MLCMFVEWMVSKTYEVVCCLGSSVCLCLIRLSGRLSDLLELDELAEYVTSVLFTSACAHGFMPTDDLPGSQLRGKTKEDWP